MDDKTKGAIDENHHDNNDNNGGWQEVTYAKKRQNKKKLQAKQPLSSSDLNVSKNGNIISNHHGNVFESLEVHSAQRRRDIEAARRNSNDYDFGDERGVVKSSNYVLENVDDKRNGMVKKNGATKGKQNKKKEKKDSKNMNMTVAEAAGKIDAADLANFLGDNSTSYAAQEEIQLMRFADYFGRAFSAVSAAQFPWLNMFKDSTLDNIADIPVCHIPEAVYKTAVDWINQRSDEALESFVLWALDSILGDLTMQKSSSKASKKGVQPVSSKSQVAMFVVISMTLRQRPEVMINLLPMLRMNSKYHGQNKLPIFVWMIIQASQGDLPIGLYLWAHYILPTLAAGGKSGSNQQTRELVLQLVERILSRPNAYKILVNGAVRKGERLIPPSTLDLLLHVTFPASTTGIKATDRFEAIYPTLSCVALAGTPRSKTVKQLSLQIQDFAFKAAREGNQKLSQEAYKLLIWCLTQNTECYKQWEDVYTNNLETSVAILKKLIQRWTELSSKLASQEALRDTVKTFGKKNEEASRGRMDAARQANFKEADKYCNVILKKIFWEKYSGTIFKLFLVVPVVVFFIYIYGFKEYSRTMDFLWN